MITKLLLPLFAALVLTVMPRSATAADLVVQPGAQVIVATSDKELVLNSDHPDGVVVVTEAAAAGSAARWMIVFDAPATPPAEPVVISYTEGGQARSAEVLVSSLPAAGNPHLVAQSGLILFSMLVVALILESAFAVIFNWRVFLEFFDGRGVRTVVMFLGALIIVWTLNLDFVGQLIALYTGNADGAIGWFTIALTALVLAGGSASVNALMVALNLRQNRTADDVAPKVAPTKAWVAFVIRGLPGLSDIELLKITTAGAAKDAAQLVGLIQRTTIFARLAKYFWRSTRRLPPSAGYTLEPDTTYAFVIRAWRDGAMRYWDATGAGLTLAKGTTLQFSPAPQSYVFAAGAVVDFSVKLSSDAPPAMIEELVSEAKADAAPNPDEATAAAAAKAAGAAKAAMDAKAAAEAKAAETAAKAADPNKAADANKAKGG